MVCCPRNASQHPECTPGAPNRPPDCIALLSASPEIGRDEVRNRHLVSSSGLPIEITYAPYEDVVLELEAAERPVLFYRWEADYLIVTNPGRFLRVDLTFAERCLPSGFGAVVHLPERDAQLCAPPPSPQPSPLPPRPPPVCSTAFLPSLTPAPPSLALSLSLSLTHTGATSTRTSFTRWLGTSSALASTRTRGTSSPTSSSPPPSSHSSFSGRQRHAIPRHLPPSPTISHHLPPSPTISHHLPPHPCPSSALLTAPPSRPPEQLEAAIPADASDINYLKEVAIFNASCGILREWEDLATHPECSSSSDLVPGCWLQWVDNSYWYEGERFVFGALVAFVVWGILILLTGDEGYTSGFSKWFWWVFVDRLLISILYSPLELYRCCAYACRKSGVCSRDKGETASAPSRGADFWQANVSVFVGSGAKSSSWEAGSTVSIGRRVLIASNAAGYVAVPLVRVGDTSSTILIRVVVHGGPTAKLGVEYGEMVEGDGVTREHDYPDLDGHGGAPASVRFEPGQRIAHVFVPVLPKREIATSDSGGAELTMQIVASTACMPAAGGGGGLTRLDELVALGPVTAATIRLINIDDYPVGVKLEKHQQARDKLLKSHSQQKEMIDGVAKGTHDALEVCAPRKDDMP